ncbi:four helix bundle protein [candidate division KSB1 bacterium]
MEKSKMFKDLIVWQKAHSFVLEVYKYTKKFPETEIYVLTSQFRKAAISIPANIAEGYRRKGLADKIRFYNISQSSLEECRYYIIFANDLNYGIDKDIMDLLEEVSKLLNSYIKKMNNK